MGLSLALRYTMFYSLSLVLFSCTASGDATTPEDTGPRERPVGEIDEGCAAEPATMELGTGAHSFETLEEGAPLTMVHGPQGGWHMLASARVANSLSIVGITFTIHDVATATQVSWNQYYIQLVPESPCVGVYSGMYGYLDVAALVDGEANTPPEVLGGREVRLRLAMEDGEGRVAEAERTVVAALDPADQ